MKHDDPVPDRAAADAPDVGDKSTATGGHGAEALTPKQLTRYSSVSMEGKLAVRGPGYEPFDLATTIGKMMAPGGTFRMLLPGESGICVVVGRFHRDRVIELARITTRAWRSYLRKWEDDRMAHRCADLSRGGVALFFRPENRCPVPSCGATLPPERKQRSVHVEAAFRISGSSVPRTVLNTGDASRDEEGDAETEPREDEVGVGPVPSKFFRTGYDEIAARIRLERDLRLVDRDIAALLNNEATIEPPAGFIRWTGFAVRVAMGEAHAA
jgi:hypothetical protein